MQIQNMLRYGNPFCKEFDVRILVVKQNIFFFRNVIYNSGEVKRYEYISV